MNEQLTIGGGCINPSMTVKQVATALSVAETTVLKYIKRVFPEKLASGKKCLLSEVEVTAVKLKMQQNQQLARSQELPKTDLEKRLLVKQAMDILNQEVEELQAKLTEAQPKIEFYDTVGNSQGLHTVAEVAKMLGTGRNRLFQWMREQSILRDNNEPYQKFIDSGYFEVRESPYRNIINVQTFLTAKGLQWIQRRYRI